MGLLALLLAGCAGARPAALSGTGGGAGRAAAPGASREAGAPWEIPSEIYRSQTLFRMEAETADGGAAVRMVLRLQGPERYRLTLSDRLGRNLYTVDVGPAGGWLADHRSRKACPIPERGGTLVLRGVPLEGFSTAALPAVLLGRVPAEPAGEIAESGEGELDFRDRQGRRWTVRRDHENVVGWTMWEAEEPVLWWRRDGDRALLSDRLRGAQLRWQAVARERQSAELGGPAVPAGFDVVDCPATETAPFDSPQGDL